MQESVGSKIVSKGGDFSLLGSSEAHHQLKNYTSHQTSRS